MSGAKFLGWPGTEPSPLADVIFRQFWTLNKGTWSAGVNYRESDIVQGSDGSGYQAIKASKGISPPNTTYWRQIVAAGVSGEPGPTGPQGDPGSVSAASSMSLDEVVSAPSTSANQIKLYNLSNGLRYRLESDGAEQIICVAGRQTIYVPASAIAPRISSGCAALARVESGSSTTPNIAHLAFDSAVDEYGQFEIDMPKSWDLGNLTAQFVWTGLVAGAGNVTWGIQAIAQSDDDPINGGFGTAVTITDSFIAEYDRHISPETAAFTVAGTPSIGDSVCFQVYRDTSGSTRAEDANLLGVRLFFTTNKGNDA